MAGTEYDDSAGENLSLYALVSPWDIANVASRRAADAAKLLDHLAHALCNVTVYDPGEMERALIRSAGWDPRRMRALAGLAKILNGAAPTEAAEDDGWHPIATLIALEDTEQLDTVGHVLLWNPCDGIHTSPAGPLFLARVIEHARQGIFTHWRIAPKGPRVPLATSALPGAAAALTEAAASLDIAVTALAEPHRCFACSQPFKDGDAVYEDANEGTIHADCLGPERESYVGADGEPLKPGEPIPAPAIYRAARPARSEGEPHDHLIRKGGYYYRPNQRGYTASPHEAGRYTKVDAEAEAAVEPGRISAVRLSDVLGEGPAT